MFGRSANSVITLRVVTSECGFDLALFFFPNYLYLIIIMQYTPMFGRSANLVMTLRVVTSGSKVPGFSIVWEKLWREMACTRGIRIVLVIIWVIIYHHPWSHPCWQRQWKYEMLRHKVLLDLWCSIMWQYQKVQFPIWSNFKLISQFIRYFTQNEFK